MKCKIIFFFVFIIAVTDAAAEISSWTDENGVKHYSNTNPPNNAENIKTFDEYIPPGNFKRQNYHKIKKNNPKKRQAGNIKSFGDVHSGSRPAINRSLNIEKNINPIRPAVNKNLNMKKRYPAANVPNNKGSKPLDFSNAFWELWYIWLIFVISLASLMAADLFKYKIINSFISLFKHRRVIKTKSLSKEKGDAFEVYIIKKFSKKWFALKDMRSDKGVEGFYPESNKYPDLVLEYKPRQLSFAVECKWRQKWWKQNYSGEKIDWAGGDGKIRNYKAYSEENNMPVFVAIGVGGKPDNPGELFVAPLEALKFRHTTKEYLKRFEKKRKGEDFFLDPEKVTLK
ncbi:MAG: DUF4124 domain-containing protein [Desulfobacterales bacterium]|nr:DUF4124 domain-containing protein [Desulfobacterales bacterium]